MSSTLFVEQFQTLLRKKGDTEAFRNFVRDNRLLLIDDVQFLASKPATEAELVEALTAVISNAGQVVLAADKEPDGLVGFDVRLANQLKSATVISIDSPDFELRRKILESKAKLYAATRQASRCLARSSTFWPRACVVRDANWTLRSVNLFWNWVWPTRK